MVKDDTILYLAGGGALLYILLKSGAVSAVGDIAGGVGEIGQTTGNLVRDVGQAAGSGLGVVEDLFGGAQEGLDILKPYGRGTLANVANVPLQVSATASDFANTFREVWSPQSPVGIFQTYGRTLKKAVDIDKKVISYGASIPLRGVEFVKKVVSEGAKAVGGTYTSEGGNAVLPSNKYLKNSGGRRIIGTSGGVINYASSRVISSTPIKHQSFFSKYSSKLKSWGSKLKSLF